MCYPPTSMQLSAQEAAQHELYWEVPMYSASHWVLPSRGFWQEMRNGEGEAASSPWWGHFQTQWHNNPATTSSEYSQYLQLCRSSLRNKLPLMNGCTIYFLLWPWLIYQDKVKMLMAPLTFLYLKYFLNFLFMQSFFTLTFKMPGCLPGAIFKFFPKLANLFSRPQPSRRNFMK